MAVEVLDPSGSPIAVRISGILRRDEFTKLQALFMEAVKHRGKVSLLVLLEDFEGWDERDNWNSVPFHLEHDEQVEKIAIVGDTKWEDLFGAFLGKGLRKIPIRHFPPAGLKTARAWLS
jgi:hypothetical protein